jgi:hypothetical protein
MGFNDRRVLVARRGRDGQRRVRADACAAVTLLTDLDAFYLEHARCGDLDSAVEGDRV